MHLTSHRSVLSMADIAAIDRSSQWPISMSEKNSDSSVFYLDRSSMADIAAIDRSSQWPISMSVSRSA
ncbi:hypothetical protein PtA15_7A599 [Puccinia triticina]|uniref:Uncharacterized protein n=1 Tax=Puccinia triticina TaxID=208348 RepID=A0ABY7CSY2_9BASI|nr:uncharacterized protein PtA15_7A599 [Puccinia triticina]WAQ86870.1 hypothetical protein PtA15_7A599 [Puccinia triticina]